VLVRHRLLEEALCLEVAQHGLARVVAVEAAVGARTLVVDLGVEGEDDDQRQAVADRHLVVVEVVGAGDLDAARAEVLVDVGVGDDWDPAVAKRQVDELADEVLVALVVGMHRERAVGEHGLGPGGGDVHALHRHTVQVGLRAIAERVEDVPHRPGPLLVLDLEVGDGGEQHRVPVHQPLAAVDQALLVERDEGVGDDGREPLVHGEVLVLPGHRVAHAAHLPGDGGAAGLLPVPDLGDEVLAPEVVARQAGFLELALDDDLGGDAGVVGARHPERVLALHAVIAHQRIHDRVLERVPHVQRAGHVRRRQLDAERGLAGSSVGS
jgi:hypothetical protein